MDDKMHTRILIELNTLKALQAIAILQSLGIDGKINVKPKPVKK